ncbi:MAG: hypothetical protein U0900_10895 [Myxococcota bacterium]
MHRFLTAFLCLSTLAMTQNVVAGTPSPLQAVGVEAIAEATAVTSRATAPDLSRASVGGEVPSPGTMLLLVTGLAGLSAVGSRRPTSLEVVRR